MAKVDGIWNLSERASVLSRNDLALLRAALWLGIIASAMVILDSGFVEGFIQGLRD